MHTKKHMEYVELIRKLPSNMEEIYNSTNNITLPVFKNILFCGMGGSGIIGDIAKDILDTEKPIFINKNYNIPDHIDSSTLAFCISYSGNTEETISMFNRCLAKNVKIISISSGGQLEKLSKENNITHIKVPSGIPPRSATGYLLTPILRLLKKHIQMNFNIPALEEKGKILSEHLLERTPVIYTSPSLRSLGLRWKQQLNENCKILCLENFLPEQNHNAINAFIAPNEHLPVFLIIEKNDHPQNKKRLEFFEKKMKKNKISFSVIEMSKENILSGILIGDFMSYYLSKKLGVDPFNIEVIESLKKSLLADNLNK